MNSEEKLNIAIANAKKTIVDARSPWENLIVTYQKTYLDFLKTKDTEKQKEAQKCFTTLSEMQFQIRNMIDDLHQMERELEVIRSQKNFTFSNNSEDILEKSALDWDEIDRQR